jgi:hypothetical protein
MARWAPIAIPVAAALLAAAVTVAVAAPLHDPVFRAQQCGAFEASGCTDFHGLSPVLVRIAVATLLPTLAALVAGLLTRSLAGFLLAGLLSAIAFGITLALQEPRSDVSDAYAAQMRAGEAVSAALPSTMVVTIGFLAAKLARPARLSR